MLSANLPTALGLDCVYKGLELLVASLTTTARAYTAAEMDAILAKKEG